MFRTTSVWTIVAPINEIEKKVLEHRTSKKHKSNSITWPILHYCAPSFELQQLIEVLFHVPFYFRIEYRTVIEFVACNMAESPLKLSIIQTKSKSIIKQPFCEEKK